MQSDGVTRDEREHADSETPGPQTSTRARDNGQVEATCDTVSEAGGVRQTELRKPAQLPDTERMSSSDVFRTGASQNDTSTTDTPPDEAATTDDATYRDSAELDADGAPGTTDGDGTPGTPGTTDATPRRGFARFKPQPGFDWVSFAVLGLGTLVLVWKMHAFKLPSQIALEQAQARGKAGPSGGILRFLSDWLRPWAWGRGDLLKDTTATGGDMGAHVWTADVIKRVVIPQWRLTGWTNEWFRGMKALGFYFPLPTLVIVALSKIIPYNIAFKLVTVAGVFSLPTTSWLSGKVAGLRRPIPTLMGIASFVFLFGRHYDLYIYGGNILSTMAGEFSFSISVSFGVLFLGLFVRVLKTGEKRGLAALCLAATGLSHLLPTMWVLLTAVLLLITHLDINELKAKNRSLFGGVLGAGGLVAALIAVGYDVNYGIVAFGFVLFGLALYDEITGAFGLRQFSDSILVMSCGGAIAGFWLLAFFEDLPFTNDMGWEKSTRYVEFLLPFWAKKPPADSQVIAVAMILASIGALVALWSLVSAILGRARQSRYWMPNSGSLSVIVSGFIGLVAGLSRHSSMALLLGILGGFLLSFIAILIISEESRWQQVVLVLVSGMAGAAAIAKWGSPIWSILAATAVVLMLLLLAAVNQLRYERWGVALTCTIAVAASIFTQSPQFRLWNARVLPFWFFSILLLSAYGAVQAVQTLRKGVAWYATPQRQFARSASWGIVGAALLTFVAVGLPLNVVPKNLPIPKVRKGLIGVQLAKNTNDSNPATGWAAYNFKGYEGQAAWPEYRALMNEAKRVSKTHGCGTAVYEYDDAKLGSFGTPLSPMLLPYWTKGCMGSMEGVYFESSATAPHHWLTAALVTAPSTNNADGSKKYSGPSNPQRDLPYQSFDLARGVGKMQEIGIKYYLAVTDLAKKTADTLPSLKKVGTSGVFAFYELVNAATVAPLTEEPVVVTGIDQDQYGGWLDVDMDRYNNPNAFEMGKPQSEQDQRTARYPLTVAWSGPKSWQRMKAEVNKPKGVRTFGTGVSISRTTPKALPPVVVSNIVEKETDISFTVDKIGVPVVVRASYFPNWSVKGAKGPYRIMPNVMVVIPTSKNVTLHWGFSRADILGYPASVAGLGGAFLLHRRTRRRKFFEDMPLPDAHDGPPTGEPVDPNAVDAIDDTQLKGPVDSGSGSGSGSGSNDDSGSADFDDLPARELVGVSSPEGPSNPGSPTWPTT